MKEKIKLIFTFISVCLFVLLSSCESEKNFGKDSETGKKMKREITFDQFKREIGQPNFNIRMAIVASATGKSLDDFTIDSTKVKALETDRIVYSMKLDPKFVPEGGKFYNLFVYKDNNDEIVKQIMGILPTIEITGDSELELFNYLQTASKELVYSSKMMSSSAICVTTEAVEICNCLGHRRDECNGCDLGFHWISIFTYSVCPTNGGSNPGNDGENNTTTGGDGASITTEPILPTKNKDNCRDLKNKSANQEFKDKMNEIKADANGTTGEKAFEMFSGTPNFSEKYSATLSDPSGLNMPIPGRTDCTGFMHCHMNDPALKNFAIFTPHDFIAQRDLIKDSTVPITSFTMYLTSQIQGVSSTFAIKITDIAKFNFMVGLMEAFPLKYFNIWKYQIKESSSPETQVNEFLKQMKNAGFEGFELYKSDENFENWEQQTLNNSGNTIKIKC